MNEQFRTVKRVLYAQPTMMGDLPIRQPFPTQLVPHLDPFLLLHHAVMKVPNDRPMKHVGVGPHPHRGFSPVTFVFKGGVHHRDSRGNNSVVYAGGTQWMHAGMGIIHSERPPDDIFNQGGVQEIIQLWINSPAKYKMDQPSYYALQKKDTPTFVSEDGLIENQVIAGSWGDVKGAIPTISPVNAFVLRAQANGNVNVPVPAVHQAFVYVLNGSIRLKGFGVVEEHHAVVFNQEQGDIGIEAQQDATLLLVSGMPINEKIAMQGPFVMNSETEILEAMRDYRMGKMGILIED